jgi:hypothetical protein
MMLRARSVSSGALNAYFSLRIFTSMMSFFSPACYVEPRSINTHRSGELGGENAAQMRRMSELRAAGEGPHDVPDRVLHLVSVLLLYARGSVLCGEPGVAVRINGTV